MTHTLTKLIAVLMFCSGSAFASINPSPSAGYEDYQATVDRILAEGSQGGCGDSYQAVSL